ncbi:hypothetical protein [Paenibacillus periandrae]|uniref:hypothetical protein n=1 Tax=Paenibacillus periandrae TaxID=1761741 RepID=UPI001F093C42|nr:hypothetical protein [Paenibacillus periandrae]
MDKNDDVYIYPVGDNLFDHFSEMTFDIELPFDFKKDNLTLKFEHLDHIKCGDISIPVDFQKNKFVCPECLFDLLDTLGHLHRYNVNNC